MDDKVVVSIIILNYNGGSDLIECLESIENTVTVNFEIILIDNNSSDNSHIKSKKLFPKIKLFKNQENIGLSARNIGIEKALGEFVVFLDSDTIVKANWITNFLTSFSEHGEGLYQPKLLEKDRPSIINSSGNMINIFGFAFSRGKGEEDVGKYDKFETISYTSGACTFSSLETLKKIGNVSELFFAYHDDVDYGWRGQILKIASYYEPKSIVLHKGSKTLQWSKKKFFLLERNRWICLYSLYSSKTLIKILPLLSIIEIGMIFYFLKNKMFCLKIKSFFSIIKLMPKIQKRYKKIQKNRTQNDKEVIKKFVDNFEVPNIAEIKKPTNYQNIITKLSRVARGIINA